MPFPLAMWVIGGASFWVASASVKTFVYIALSRGRKVSRICRGMS